MPSQPSTPTLIIETSSTFGEVGLALGDTWLGQRQLPAARRHARDLIPNLKQLLDDHQIAPNALSRVMVNQGPGSYTGLRVGLMAAKTLCFAHDLPLLTLDAPAVLAQRAFSQDSSVQRLATLIDAQRGLVYLTLFERTEGEFDSENLFRQTQDTCIVQLSDWLGQQTEPLHVTGPALARFADALTSPAVAVDSSLWEPTCQSLWLAGQTLARPADVLTVEPIYLRPSAAEENWETNQARASAKRSGSAH